MATKYIEVDGAAGGRLAKEVNLRKDRFTTRDTIMHNIRRYRTLRQNPYVPKAYAARFRGDRAVKVPIIMRTVQTAVSAIMKKSPTVWVDPLSPQDKKAAEEQGKHGSLLLQSVEEQQNTPFLYGLAFNHLGDGTSVVKTLPGPWSGMPIREEGEEAKAYNDRVRDFTQRYPLPFYARRVDPLTFYPPLEEWGGGTAIESAYRPLEDVARSLGAVLNDRGQMVPREEVAASRIPEGMPYAENEPPPGVGGSVRVDEVWDKDRCAVIVQGQSRIFVFDNPLGELPYDWAFADPTGLDDPTNVGMSIAYPLYYLAPQLDTLIATMMAWAVMVAPTPYTTQDPVPGVRPTTENAIDVFQPGKMHHFATGRKPGIMQPPDAGRNLTQMMQFLMEVADRGGLPAMMSGSGIGTRLPALTFSAAMEAASDRLRPAVLSLERMLGSTMMKWFSLIGRYDVPVKVNGWEYLASGEKETKRWATIKPEEARKGRRISVSLAVDSTQDQIAKGTHAQFMQSAGLWSQGRAMRFSGVENPDEEWNEIAADFVKRASLQPLANAIMMGDPDIGPLLQQAQAGAAAGGGEGGGGAPPGPGRNREGVPPGRGGGRRGTPTQRPRGNRQGAGRQMGRT